MGHAVYSLSDPRERVFRSYVEDLAKENKSSPIFTHHINYVNKAHYKREMPYEQTEPNQIVVDYIASMTDDYFIELHEFLFPNSKFKINYKSYFEDLDKN
jgi:dGTPase